MEHVGLTLNMTNSVGLCPQFWPIELKRTYGTQLPKTHYYAHEPLKSVWLGLWVQGSESTISTNNSNSRRALSTLRVGKWIFDDFRWFFCRIRRWHFVCSMLHFSGKKCVLFFPQETTNQTNQWLPMPPQHIEFLLPECPQSCHLFGGILAGEKNNAMRTSRMWVGELPVRLL